MSWRRLKLTWKYRLLYHRTNFLEGTKRICSYKFLVLPYIWTLKKRKKEIKVDPKYCSRWLYLALLQHCLESFKYIFESLYWLFSLKCLPVDCLAHLFALHKSGSSMTIRRTVVNDKAIRFVSAITILHILLSSFLK